MLDRQGSTVNIIFNKMQTSDSKMLLLHSIMWYNIYILWFLIYLSDTSQAAIPLKAHSNR